MYDNNTPYVHAHSLHPQNPKHFHFPSRVRRNSKASEDVEYPAYGVTGPAGGKETSPTSGADRKLAQNAQMYHYQHQKQQMIAFDR